MAVRQQAPLGVGVDVLLHLAGEHQRHVDLLVGNFDGNDPGPYRIFSCS